MNLRRWMSATPSTTASRVVVGGVSSSNSRTKMVKGMNLRRWMSATPSTTASGAAVGGSSGNAVARKKMVSMLEALGKLVRANLLQLNFTEYDLTTEFKEALEHALDNGKGTKAVPVPDLVSVRFFKSQNSCPEPN
eukprot:gene4163-14263_t